MSAFRLGRYAQARTFLSHVSDDVGDAAATRGVVERTLADDPLASRLGSDERRRRLASILAYTQDRLRACAAGRSNGQPTEDDVALQQEAERLSDKAKRAPVLELDVIEAGVDLVHRIANHLSQTCGPPTARDRALALIGRGTG